MRLEAWLPMYREICQEFGYDEESDRASAELLWSFLSTRWSPSVDDLDGLCPPEVTVCGDSPSLAASLAEDPPTGYVVAADGATSALLDADILPRAIVTDLDGPVEDQVEAGLHGALVFVHAHGDNTAVVRSVLPRLQGAVVGTCQCAPVGGLLNMGGFTDGDRAACIFSSLGARRIRLVGFDFDHPSEKAGRSPEVKLRKLAWARRVLGVLADEGVQLSGL